MSGPRLREKQKQFFSFWLTAVQLILAVRAVQRGVAHLAVGNAGAVIAVHVGGLTGCKREKAISKSSV